MALRHLTSGSLTGLAVFLGLASGLSAAEAQQEPLVPVHGSVSVPLATLNEAAKPALTRPLYLTFSLKRAHIAELNAFIAAQQNPKSRDYHHWLQPDEVGTRFGASNADIATVVQYAHAQHLNASVWSNRMFVSVQATVAQAQSAFHVTLHGYSRPGNADSEGLSETFFAPDRAPMVPASIAARVEGIYGLSDALQMRPVLKRSKHAMTPLPQGPAADGDLFSQPLPINPPAGGGTGISPDPLFSSPLTPAQISKVYNFDGLHALGYTGKGYSIAIFSPTTVADSDIKTFCSSEGLSVPNINHIQVDGGATSAGGSLEACLDAEVILGQAPDASVYFYESPNNGNMDVWNQIAKDNISVISDSWAYNELSLQNNGNGPFMDAMDKIFATMEAQGISHYNSSGDSGSSPGGTLAVDFPGSSTHVTSVGGTSLYGDSNGNYSSETGWGGSGGGLSVHFARPTWQIGPGVSNSSSNGMRQMPDISALADGGTPGYLIYGTNNGQTGWWQVGGTSASTPLWAVLNKLTAQRLNNIRTGVLNTSFYGIGNAYGSNPIFCYHDVTTGTNTAYSCTSNWDFVTGWGSANMTKFTADLLQNYWSYAYADLYPYNPGGTWTSPVMIHSDPSNIAEPATFNSTTKYYFTVATASNGIADALTHNDSIQIDGVDTKFSFGAMAAGYYYSGTPLFTTLTPGAHTIKLIANVDGTIKESNTANNTFTRTINVVNSSLAVPQSLTLNPTTILGGHNGLGVLTMSAPTTAATAVTLSSSNTAVVNFPLGTTVTVAKGATTAHFAFKAYNVTASTPITITATANGTAVTATETVVPLGLLQFLVSPSSIEGGAPTALYIYLTGAAKTGGYSVTLTNSNPGVVSVPTTVLIPAGASAIAIPLDTNLVATTTTVNFTAAAGGTTLPATLTLVP